MYLMRFWVAFILEGMIFGVIHYVITSCSLLSGVAVHPLFKRGSPKTDDIYWIDFSIFIYRINAYIVLGYWLHIIHRELTS